MLSALKLADHRFPTFDPFLRFGDMDSEIAELRTMTRVTKLRQQIECKQEGAWMSVRDVPDDRSKGGTRKVTTFGRATRSITRSFISDMDMGDFLTNGFHDHRRKPEPPRSAEPEAIVEFPDDDRLPSVPKESVEITEVSSDSDPAYTEDIAQPNATRSQTSPHKKTSVVTLGQGNVVLIDQQDSNFKVTGNSKENTADDDPSSKNYSDKNDKKVKKVEFCKTEVHFAPDSGKVNIVETDEKPPSSQLLRRKKRLKKDAPSKTTMPKLYFGDAEKELFFEDKTKTKDDEEIIGKHSFPVIRESSPLLSTGIASLNQLKSDFVNSWDGVPKIESALKDFPSSETNGLNSVRASHDSQHNKSKIDLTDEQQNITPNRINFVGNVRKDTSHYALPKKSSCTELRPSETIIPTKFETAERQSQCRSKEDSVQQVGCKLKKFETNFVREADSSKTSYLGNVSPKLSKLIKNDIQHEFQLKQMEIMRKGRATEVKMSHEFRDSSPKVHDPEPTVHIQVTSDVPQVKLAPVNVVTKVTLSGIEKSTSPPEPKPRKITDPVYVNNQVPKTRTIKVVQEKTSQPRTSLTKISIDDRERRRARATTRTTSQSERSVKKSAPVPKPRETPKTREIALVKPIGKQCPRSTITRLSEPCKRARTPRAETPEVGKSTRRPLEKDDVRTIKSKEPLRSFEKVSNGWVGHCIIPIKAKPAKITVTTASHSAAATSSAVSSKIQGSKKSDGTAEFKQSTVSKFQSKGSTLTAARKQFSLSKEHLKSAKLVKELYNKDGEHQKPDLPRPRSNTEDRASTKHRTNLVSRRRLLYEEGANRFRRDSEQSDDSVVRADEEVRAYMFNNSKKKSDER